MNKNLQTFLVLSLIAVITYIICEYLINSIFFYDYQTQSHAFRLQLINPLRLLPYSFSLRLLLPIPIILTILLFLMQYSSFSINKKNILYIILVTITSVIIYEIIVAIFIYPYLFKYLLTIDELSLSILYIYSALEVTFLINGIGLVSYYYFKSQKINSPHQTIPPSPSTNKHLIAFIYTILVITSSFFAAEYFIYNPYTYPLESYNNPYNYIYAIILAIISSIYVYSWTCDLLKSQLYLKQYAINGIKAYSITMLSTICLVVVLNIGYYWINQSLTPQLSRLLNPFIIFAFFSFSIFMIICTVLFFYIAAGILIYYLYNKANSILYKTTHWSLFILITVVAVVMTIQVKISPLLFFAIHGFLLFVTSLCVWFGYFLINFAVSKSFR